MTKQAPPPVRYPRRDSSLQKQVQDDGDMPICVLKVELDNGEKVHMLRVYEGQIPEEIVEEFAEAYNISENAKHKLLNRIYEQIQI